MHPNYINLTKIKLEFNNSSTKIKLEFNKNPPKSQNFKKTPLLNI